MKLDRSDAISVSGRLLHNATNVRQGWDPAAQCQRSKEDHTKMRDSPATKRDATSGRSSPVTSPPELRQARQSTSTPTPPSTSLDRIAPHPSSNTTIQAARPQATPLPVESPTSRPSSSPIRIAAFEPLLLAPQLNNEMSLPPRPRVLSSSSDGGAPLPPDMLQDGQNASSDQARGTQSDEEWTLIDTFDTTGLAYDGLELLEEAHRHSIPLAITTGEGGGQHSAEQYRSEQRDEIKNRSEHDTDENGEWQQGELQGQRDAKHDSEHDAELDAGHLEDAHPNAWDAPPGEHDQPDQSSSSANVPIADHWAAFSNQSVDDAVDKLQLPGRECAGGFTKQLFLDLAIQFVFETYSWLDSFQRDIPLLDNTYSEDDLAASFYVQYGVVIWDADETNATYNDSVIADLTTLFDAMRTGDYRRESYPAASRDTLERLIGRSRADFCYALNSSHEDPNASASTHDAGSEPSLHDQFLDLRINPSLDSHMAETLLRSATAQIALEVLSSFGRTGAKALGPELAEPSVEIIRNIRGRLASRYGSSLWPSKQLSNRDMKALEAYISAIMTLPATEDSLQASGSSPIKTMDIFLQLKDVDVDSDGLHFTCMLAPISDEESCQKTFASKQDLACHLVQVHEFSEREAKDSAAECAYSLRHQKDEE